jgi:hypothetical protein
VQAKENIAASELLILVELAAVEAEVYKGTYLNTLPISSAPPGFWNTFSPVW